MHTQQPQPCLLRSPEATQPQEAFTRVEDPTCTCLTFSHCSLTACDWMAGDREGLATERQQQGSLTHSPFSVMHHPQYWTSQVMPSTSGATNYHHFPSPIARPLPMATLPMPLSTGLTGSEDVAFYELPSRGTLGQLALNSCKKGGLL